MSGPWANYAPQQGPWSNYAKPQQAHPNGWLDSAMSTASGLANGVAGLMMQIPGMNVAAPVASAAANAALGKLGVIPQADANRRTGQALATATDAVLPSMPLHQMAQHTAAQQTLFSPMGGDYTPKTTVGRYAKAIAANAPNAAFGGEGLIPKAAAVVLPGLLGQGAQDATAAMGGSPAAQRIAGFVGGVGGGLLAGRMGAPTGPKPLEPSDAAVDTALTLAKSSPEDVRAGMQGGVLPVAASPGLAGLGEAMASTPGQAGILLRDAIAERQGSQTDRALQAAADTLGVDPNAARGDIGAIVQAGQNKAGPLYKAATSQAGPVWNPDLAQLAQRPAIRKAMDIAANGMLNRGQDPRTVGFALDPDTGWGISGANPSEGVAELQPTAELWDRTYKALGQSVERNPVTNRPVPNSVSTNNADVAAASGDLRSALSDAIPGYDKALAAGSDYLSVQNAFDRTSGKLFAGKVSDFADLWKSLKTDPERQAAQSALANDVLELADRNQNGLNPGRFRAPGVQKKLALAFGNDKAQAFVDQMESDAGERAIYNQITDNSRTTPRAELIKTFQAQNPQQGGILGKALGAAEWAQSAMHPTLLMTKLAHAGVNAVGKKPAAGLLPWENPETASQLGGLLTDPTAMSGALDRITAQQAAAAQFAARQRGARYQPLYSGLLGFNAAQPASAEPR